MYKNLPLLGLYYIQIDRLMIFKQNRIILCTLIILQKGTSSFVFYAADATTTYSIVIEGITNDGKVFRQVQQVARTER